MSLGKNCYKGPTVAVSDEKMRKKLVFDQRFLPKKGVKINTPLQ
jgi:hypothetical protein